MKNSVSKTYLKEIKIKKFRGLDDITIPIAERITLISGKNATSKSTILGIIAHTFNFEKNYVTDQVINNKTIWGSSFISKFSEHFKLSEVYDPPHSMDLEGIVFDKESQKDIYFTQEMGDYTKQDRQRVVVRYKNSENEKQDRKITHPVIFLGLKRLLPIVERQTKKISFDYFEDDKNRDEFIKLSNRILLKVHHHSSSNIASTESKLLKSTVAHGKNYDENSVSVGEDNVGQIIIALLSFKKLANEIGASYQGGILLIDEIENSLFPAAQLELLKVFNEYASTYNIQIIMTSHSPILMRSVLELNQERNRLLYLTNSYGKIEVVDWEWEQIEADISGHIIPASKKITSTKRIDCYVEDEEAKLLLNTLLYRNNLKKHLKIDFIKGFGCKHYLTLIEKVPHIKNNTLIILDGDLRPNKEKLEKMTINKVKHPNAIALPTSLPPDQLLFLILHNLPEDSPYWKNQSMFTKSIFSSNAQEVYTKLSIPATPININEFECKVDQYRKNQIIKEKPGKKVREIFKDLFKNPTIRNICKSNNPFKYYFDKDDEGLKLKQQFINEVSEKLLNLGVIKK
ncbi:ATP-dependent nuclease [Gallibacterium anatis]|uniref:ATP-dependent nuclease n=1 Tax=Gallibacterium anatis TaxID=750 RepID=UPI0022B24C99|nr:AAA family ATPase [Gallibacterium anatis]WAX71593.1 AAA family ATPase [Gallibacterium anatis]